MILLSHRKRALMKSTRKRYVILLIPSLIVLVTLGGWDFGGSSEIEIEAERRSLRETIQRQRQQQLAKEKVNKTSEVVTSVTANAVTSADLNRKDWSSEEAELIEALPFLKRSESIDATLAKLNKQHTEQFAIAYPNGKLDPLEDERKSIHLFYTTDCTQHSLWQAFALENSWNNVNHPGAISRLVSGCITKDGREKKMADMMSRKVTDHKKNFVFFGPTINSDAVPGPEGGKHFVSYPPINRPSTFYYWISHSRIVESYMALLDPDMIFMKPLYFPSVSLGNPAGQYYDYLISEDWDKQYDSICPDCQPLGDTKKDFCPGPPHIMHTRDWNNLGQYWLRFTVEARKKWGKWVAEMAGMSIGLAKLNLRSKLEKNGMWDRPHMELIDTMKQFQIYDHSTITVTKPVPSHIPRGMHPVTPDSLPSLLHYCFTPEIGRKTYPDSFWETENPQRLWESTNKKPLLHYIHWSKYRTPSDWPGGDGYPSGGSLLQCDQDLLFEIPPITWMVKYYTENSDDKGWVLMLAGILPAINDGIIAYRNKYCENGGKKNPRKIIRTAHPGVWRTNYELVLNDSSRFGFLYKDSDGYFIELNPETDAADAPRRRPK